MLALALTMATLAAASPLVTRQNFPPCNCPDRQVSDGFTLVANLSDPHKIFDPPVQHWTLRSVHVGAGLNAAILSPELDYGHVFFVNGTGRDVSAQATSINLPPYESGSGPVPMGLQFSQSASRDKTYVGVNIGAGTVGAGIVGGLRSAYPIAFAPFQGKFMVCNESQPAYGRPQYPVLVAEEVPANCVEMKLLAQCATLPPLLGTDKFGFEVRKVDCYENVKAIDWTKY